MTRSLRSACWLVSAALIVASSSGCTSFPDYFRNGFKVGPNYCRPGAPVAKKWIDADDIRQAEDPCLIQRWWTVFNDPRLNLLVDCAYKQNLSLREAGCRILQARAQRDIVVGNIFPQSQTATGRYTRSGIAIDPNAAAIGNRFTDSWSFGFNLNWELDFWGRFRRAITAANADLDASVYAYDDVLVTLLADVASNYVTVRTTQQRIELLRENVDLQRKVLKYIEDRFNVKGGSYKVTALDLDQAISNLRQTEAGIPQLEIALRQAENRLCILMGMPPADLSKLLGDGPIPTSPPEVAIGIPADLLRRRPDVRRAERLVAAQAEEIGIAEADLYPAFTINGAFGYSANKFADLFRGTSFNGNFGPSFQWNLLNYGRIVNNVRLNEARFQELVLTYQNTVLTANEEVELGLVTFLRAQQRSKLLDESVTASRKAVEIVILQYEKGTVDFNRYATIEQNLVTQQDTAAQAHGQISQGLIEVYRAVGGGWEIRLNGPAAAGPLPGDEREIPASPIERLPAPNPEPAPL